MKKLSIEYEGKSVIYKVNTDVEQELASVFGIQSIPTILFIGVDGEPTLQPGAFFYQNIPCLTPSTNRYQGPANLLKIKMQPIAGFIHLDLYLQSGFQDHQLFLNRIEITCLSLGGCVDPSNHGLLYLFGLMHLIGKYRIIVPANN